MEIIRCDWANKTALEQHYHDTLWGKPVHEDKELFKMIILEGKQAGLSWATILAKMDTLCLAFDDFDPHKLAAYNEEKVEELLKNDGIIKNRLKVNAVIHNARMYFNLCEKYGSLDEFLWGHVNHQPILNHWEKVADVPASTPLSDEISKQLKKEGFKFVGTTTVYALMQSIGMVNDHILTCHYRNA
jgi:DNA-3-methyladenine glycosylase I